MPELTAAIIRKIFWNLQGFSWDDYLYSTDYQKEINEIVQVVRDFSTIPSPSLLDVGCATGCFSYTFAEKGFRVTGLDYARNMLRKAELKKTVCKGSAPDFVFGDYTQPLSFNSESFDFIFASHVFQAAGNYPEIVQEISRVLKNNGILVLVIKRKKTVKKHDPGQRLILNLALKALKTLFTSRKQYSFRIPETFFDLLQNLGLIKIAEHCSLYNHVLVFRKVIA